MKIKCSIGVIVECVVFDDGSHQFMVRQPNGQPMAFLSCDDELGSFFSDLRSNVIASNSSEPQSAIVE